MAEAKEEVQRDFFLLLWICKKVYLDSTFHIISKMPSGEHRSTVYDLHVNKKGDTYEPAAD